MRIASVDIPDNKRVEIALTYIFGIGRKTSAKMLIELAIDLNKRVKDLTPEEVNKIQKYLTDNQDLKIEGDLRRQVSSHIARLVAIGCYRGIRHREGLPVRGQRSRNKGGKRRDKRRKVALR